MKNTIKPINLNTDGSSNPQFTGIEYQLPFASVRKFDDGHRAYFFYGDSHMYVIHVSPKTTRVITKYRIELIIHAGKDVEFNFYGYGNSRKESFRKLRAQLTNVRKFFTSFKLKAARK
jgi:hypothetical protein